MLTSETVREFLRQQLEDHEASLLWLSNESGVPYATVHDFMNGGETTLLRVGLLLEVFDSELQLHEG